MCPFKHKQAMSCSETCPPLKKQKKHFSLFWNLLVYFDVSFYECHLHLHYKKNVSHKMWRRCDNKITLIKEKQTQWKEWKTETN